MPGSGWVLPSPPVANEAVSRLELSGAFPQLTRDQLIEAAGSSRLVELGAGQPLLIEGSEPSHAFVLVSGALEVTREIGGVPIHLGVIADPGSVVGEVAMLTGGTRNATVRADQASTVVEIERRDFSRLLDLDLAAARRISQDAIRRILLNDGGTAKTFLQIIQEKNKAQGKPPATRTDLRFGQGPNGQIFLLNKRDGTIRLLVP